MATVSRRSLLIGGCSLSAGIPVFGADVQTPRVALVVGNAQYLDAPLQNSVNDARAVASTLRDIGYTVFENLNVTRPQFLESIAKVRTELENRKGVAIFYYAGHAVQLAWKNYLIPVEARIETPADVTRRTLDIKSIFDGFSLARARLTLVVLDACRNNPFGSLATGAGLAPIDAPVGTYVAYATAPGNVAEDGNVREGNGTYTKFLLSEIRRPNARIEEVFKRVRFQVRRATSGRQVPWDISNLEEDFDFTRGIVPFATLEGAARESAFETERLAWNAIRSSRNPEDFYAFLKQYPNGFIAEVAVTRLEELDRSQIQRQYQQLPGKRFVVGDRYAYLTSDWIKNTHVSLTREITSVTEAGVAFNGQQQPSVALDGGVMRAMGLQFDPPIVQFPVDMTVGKRWRSAYVCIWSDGTRQNHYWEYQVEAVERFVALAGTFTAFRVSGKGDGTLHDGGWGSWTSNYWVDTETLVKLREDYQAKNSKGKAINWFRTELQTMERRPRVA